MSAATRLAAWLDEQIMPTSWRERGITGREWMSGECHEGAHVDTRSMSISELLGDPADYADIILGECYDEDDYARLEGSDADDVWDDYDCGYAMIEDRAVLVLADGDMVHIYDMSGEYST